MRTRLATSLALALVLAAPAAARADDTGGTAFEGPPTADLTPGGVVGGTVRWSGTVPVASAPVRVESFDEAAATWSVVDRTTADENGDFLATWRGDRAGDFTVRAVPEGDGASGAGDPPVARVTIFRGARATWYGPGFYGHRLACGGKLTTTTLGVAHRTLPCGTQLQVFYRGRSLVVPVVDRGPFANGASYDLTAATAQALGFQQTSRVGVAPRATASGARKRPKHTS